MRFSKTGFEQIIQDYQKVFSLVNDNVLKKLAFKPWHN